MKKDTAVLFASSDVYAFALFVSIKTFLAHSPALAARADIYIYAYRWPQAIKDVFKREFPITLIDFDLPASVPYSKSIEYFTPALFARFEGFALAQKYDNVVCMDSDILVQKEIEGALATTHQIGMTPDRLPSLANNFWGPIDGYDLSGPCLNAGFIVIKRPLPAAQIHTWLYQMLHRYAPICYLGDQGLINLVFQHFKLTPTVLPVLYNKPASCPRRVLKKAYIIHATGPRKFWQYYYFDEWYEGYKRWYQLTQQPIRIRKNTAGWDKLLAKTGWNKYVFFQLAPDGFKHPDKFLIFTFKRWLRIQY
ncbi:MAG: hypothetical protein J6Q05_03800 [Elusimicrobiaceae bacterium]|nr:hypothetical protein [Elusimicrobiaceae bacterium]